MTRLAIVAPQSYQKEIIETLHDARLAQIEEFTTPEGEALEIGDPLPEGSNASELLVRIRGLLHTLDLEDATPARRLEQTELRRRLEEELDGIEAAVEDVSSTLSDLESRKESTRERIQQLEPLQELPLDLDHYHGYGSLDVYVGTTEQELASPLAAELDRYEHFQQGDVHAVFVANEATREDETDDAEEILTRAGFEPLELPQGTGELGSTLSQLERDLDDIQRRLEEAEDEKRRLAEKHRDLLLCAEEDLSITVEKAEAPLDFASTERTFVVDAWVPTDDVDQVRSAVDEAAHGHVHFEKLDEGDRDEDREEEPPTQYEHAAWMQPFAFLTDTYSTPRYSEIDPTLILALVFPLFLGFMIGDLGYGILMIGLGFYLYRAFKARSEALTSLGFALGIAGIWASIFGAVVFRDFLGIPFYEGSHHGWPELLGISGFGTPLISKLQPESMLLESTYAWGVPEMLALSILAAFVHLFIAYGFAFVNHLGHDTKHALAQVGWLTVLTGFLFLTAVEGPTNLVSETLLNLAGDPSTALTLYVVGGGVLVLLLTEGLLGLMETVSLLAHIVSYTRLAAIAVAKAGILVAFTDIIVFGMMLGEGAGIALIAVGLVLFTLVQLMMFALGMLSGGIQSIRLNYVEFFIRFFNGGGKRFNPFGRSRRFTIESDTHQEVRHKHG